MFLFDKHIVYEEVLFVHKYLKRLKHFLYFLSLINILLLVNI